MLITQRTQFGKEKYLTRPYLCFPASSLRIDFSTWAQEDTRSQYSPSGSLVSKGPGVKKISYGCFFFSPD